MTQLLAGVLALAFGLLGALHLAWAAGFRGGSVAVLPTRDGQAVLRPGPGSALVVAALLAAAALLVLQRGGLVGALIPPAVAGAGIWTVAAVMAARAIGDRRYVGFLKSVTDSPFARMDTRWYSPIALALGIGTGLVAWLSA
ncbi:MAG TPA: DUF3995 domain-containing protein [Gemmatimonadales bacterium]|nr:DUF3995 domain-containing protein [Gemmatimonadales bacterium]